MADYKDLDEFGFEPIEEINDDELSEFGFEPELELPQQEIEPEEMGAAEAALTGFGQGASFGLTPIIAGATGAAGEVIEDIGDVLGLTTDAELEKKGFKVQDDYEGLQGLVDAYYAQRDRQLAQEQKAFEDQPVANIAGNIAGGLTSMGGAAKATGALGKLLPKAESVKGLSTLGRAGVAAREGAKAGGLAGFGAGEGKLLEGELAKTAKETAGTAIGGAAFGGGLSLGGSALKGLAGLLKGTQTAKNIGVGYEAGKKGINVSDDEQITKYLDDVVTNIRKSISKNFKGASKKQILDQADELGVRVAAGESIDDIVNEIKKSGGFGKKGTKELEQFVEDIKLLSKEIDPDLQKTMKKVESGAAKKLNKLQREGADLKSRTEFDTPFDEISPLPENKGRVIGTEDNILLPDGSMKKLTTQASILEGEVPLKQYDLDSLKLSELDEIISNVGTRAYQGGDDAAIPYAKKLYASLRELSNNALEESSLPEKNKKLKALFDGLDSLGIKPKDFFSSLNKNVDDVELKIFDKIKASALSGSDKRMRNFLKYLSKADQKLAEDIAKESKFASGLSKFITQSDAEGSTNIRAALGSFQKIAGKLGNIAGSGVKGTKYAVRESMDKLRNMTPEDVLELGTMMSEKYGDSANAFINQLNKAVNSPGQRKNALMYGIYQQPGFRKMLEGLGRNIVGEDEDIQEVENNENVSDFSNADDSVGFDKKKVGREPQGIFDKAVMSESSGGKFRDNRKNKSDVPSVGSLQFIEETAKGFLENNPQYKQNFEGMDFNSDSFFNKWNNLEDNDPNFLKDTKEYLKQTNLDPVLREFEIDPRDMQSYASLSTQLGPRLLKKAIENAGSTDINDVTNYLIDNIDRFFKTYKSKGGDLTPIVNRFKNMQR